MECVDQEVAEEIARIRTIERRIRKKKSALKRVCAEMKRDNLSYEEEKRLADRADAIGISISGLEGRLAAVRTSPALVAP
ncbi:MAG: hypothetical protein HYT49_00780 [Candidatus Wildermuthbacteria bacterium]|nr:hypothetical protein [Candidatus Wildermuthbacteria bacterium]